MPYTDTDYDIAIVGAGIAGCALAVALADSGLRIALLEPNPLPDFKVSTVLSVDSFSDRVSAITPKSQQFLQRLDAWEPLLERACPYGHMTVWDGEGTGRIDFDAADVSAPALGHIVENRLLVATLLERVRKCAAIQLLNPARLAHCERTPAGIMQLSLQDGQSLRCHLLVGADGALSSVRAMMAMATREWNYHQQAMVATIQVESPHQHTAWQRFLATGPLAFLPLTSSEDAHFCSIVWSMDDACAKKHLAMSDAQFQQALGEASEYCLGQIVNCSPRAAFPLRQRHAIDYVQTGVALVADAAHTLHPLAGQGINLGLADVSVLADELLWAQSRSIPIGSEQVLRRYQRQRQSENLAMMTAMEGFKRLFGETALPLRWLRNAGMSGVNRMTGLKHRLMRQAMGLPSRF